MSLSVIKYNNLESLLNLEFDLSAHSRWKVVCPNPTLADAFREKMGFPSSDFSLETTTVSKYLSDLMKVHFPEKKVFRKSELFLMMATVWKMKFSEEDSSLFHQAFEILTDLRSFTLEKQLIENLLEHYHPVVSEAVKTFWLVMENQNVLDEHQAYSDLNEVLLSPYTDQEEEASIEGAIFLGFTHLSANQIEIFKSLGKTRKVYLPIPNEIIENAQWTDWTKWVDSQAENHIELGQIEKENNISLVTHTFPKGRGNKFLKALLEEKKRDVLFFKKKISFKEVMEVPSRDHFFRSDTDLFDYILTDLKSDLEGKFLARNISEVNSEEIKIELKERFSGFKGRSFKDFKNFKVLQLVYKELENYIEYSEVNEKFGLFDFDILWEVIGLNLPRNFNLPLLKEPEFLLLGLNDIHKVKNDRELIFFVDGDHDLKSGGGANYSSDVQEILITLGPMRRSSLDIEFYQFYLKELLRNEKATVLLESGLMEHDQSLNLLFKDFRMVSNTIDLPENTKRGYVFTPNLANYEVPKHVSPSRLQSYIECPRKYYFSNIVKLGQEPKRKESIDPRLLGQAEHEIVDEYLKNNNEFVRDRLDNLIEEVARRTFPQEVMDQPILKEEIEIELLNYSQFLIGELLKLKNIDSDLELEFEVEFKTENSRGFIDLIVKSPKLGTMIFDMKRSSSSIPDKSKVNNYSSIQVLFYLMNYEKNWADYSAFGYLNLSDLSQSLIYTPDENVLEAFRKSGFLNLEEFIPKVTRNRKTIPFEEFYSEFETFIEEKISEFKEDTEFKAIPKDTSACMFCPGSLICDRGQE